jgi:putative oxidoreductase
MQFFDRLKPLGLLILRAALGASFIYHGYPKLSDPAHALRQFAGYGFPPYFAYIFGILEVFGGACLIAGLFTRGIALLLAIEVGLVFVRAVLPSVLGAMALALVTTGAGAISIDAFTFESQRKSPKKSKAKD